MKTEYSLEELEGFDRTWTDNFARRKGWEEHYLVDPVDALTQFFSHIPGKRMLDVGCGWGRYVHRFIEQDLDYTGLDHSCEMLAVAKANNPGVRFTQGTFRQIPFPDDHFDGLWSCCSLSAVPKKHIVSVLAEHHRVIKVGGVMTIILPSLHYSDEDMYEDDDGGPSTFQAHYVHNEFVDYINQTEFTIVDTEDWYFSQGSMSVLLRK